VDVGKIAYWNGTSWLPLDVFCTDYAYGVIRDRYGNIYFGYNGTIINTAAITLVTNPGSSETPAQFYVSGSGRLVWIENQTTGRRMYLDMTLLVGEEVFIDCSTGKALSSIRGDVSYAILPGSDMRAWKLIPGENKIACLVLSDVGASVQVSFATRHLSADATERNLSA
jgi:phage-related protein